MALVRIDLEHLTGMGWIDEPLHQIVDLLYYGFLVALVSLFLTGTKVTNSQLLHYYAYGKGVSFALLSFASLAGIATFLALSGYSIQGAVITLGSAVAVAPGSQSSLPTIGSCCPG
jgi:hypothetical protein